MASRSRFMMAFLLGLVTTSALAGEVRTRKYPHGILLTLNRRAFLANSANANAHPYFIDSSLDRKDIESFQDGCFYVNETQKLLGFMDADLRSREAMKALRDRRKHFEALRKSMDIGTRAKKICRAHDPSKSADVIALLGEQRAVTASLFDLIH